MKENVLTVNEIYFPCLINEPTNGENVHVEINFEVLIRVCPRFVYVDANCVHHESEVKLSLGWLSTGGKSIVVKASLKPM